MIEINRETGNVSWNGFTLHPHLTHDEFVRQYPTISLFRSFYSFSGLERTYQFPEIEIDNYLLIPQVRYINDRGPGVYFDVEGACYYEPDPECSMSQLLERSKTIRRLLINNLGQPKRYNPYCFGLLDGTLTAEEIDTLQAWEYDFEWGGAQTCCFFEQGDVVTMGFSVGYSLHHQQATWDKLTEDCNRHIQYEREYDCSHIEHLLEIRSLIDVIHSHFEIQQLNPYITAKGFTFIIDGVAKMTLDVNPDDVAHRYKIWSRAKTSFIAEGDYSRLIDELRLFFEAETL